MDGTYNTVLVALSLAVAVLAAYTALDMADRVNRSRRQTAKLWLLAGGLTMGVGIWSMHFIGMLAFRLPIATAYAPGETLLSMGAGIASSTFALWLVSQSTLPMWRVIPGAVLMGLGIAAMHYLGMEAMHMQPGIDYNPAWFMASIAVAIVVSWTALRVFFLMRNHQRWSLRLGASLLLGSAVVSMHYTGMAAANFPEGAICGAAIGHTSVNPMVLAILVSVLTASAMAVALTLSMMDKKVESRMLRMRNAMLALSLEEANAELSMASLRDSLTRLPNRHLLMTQLREILVSPAAENATIGLLLIDINDFRKVNEAYGHAGGDQVLVAVADRLGEFIRPGELLARTGSDEFVLVSRVDDEADGEALAARILSTFSSGLELSGKPLSLTASIGLAFSPLHDDNPEGLLSCADTAMRQAKLGGRNIFQRFVGWMSENSQEQMHLLGELGQVLEQGLLTLLYQPKWRTRDNCVVGAEVQLCWEHATAGQIPAARIAQMADRCGLTARLGKWMIEQACAQLGLWHRAGQSAWSISLNLSPLQFQDPELTDHISRCLERHALPARRLILEISEAMLMRDSRAAVAQLNSLAALGIGVSIDDFGTGYASLMHLKQLPTTEMKIGPTFLEEMTQGSADSVIVSALIGLGHGLEMDVVAEGVSTREQRLQLERMGCDFLQGPLLGQPVSPARFIQLHAPRPVSLSEDESTAGSDVSTERNAPPQPG